MLGPLSFTTYRSQTHKSQTHEQASKHRDCRIIPFYTIFLGVKGMGKKSLEVEAHWAHKGVLTFDSKAELVAFFLGGYDIRSYTNVSDRKP